MPLCISGEPWLSGTAVRKELPNLVDLTALVYSASKDEVPARLTDLINAASEWRSGEYARDIVSSPRFNSADWVITNAVPKK